MGYIKKLKNNELVGGTDKTTIYPVTSAEAVFEEVIEDGESNFKSQKFLNNNITGDRINEGTITDYNIATGTITKGKLSSQVQTMLDEGQKKALTPKGDYDAETVYEALDLVFDRDSNSSYVSLITPNTEPLTNEDAWEMFLDGTSVNTAQATINAKVDVLDAQVDEAIGQAQQDVRDLVDETAAALQAATDEANNAAGEARDAASTVETLTSQQVADAQIGYFTCTNTAASGAADNETKITTTDAIGESHYVKTVGSHVKVKMAVANTHAAPVYLQFGSNTANKAQLYYNGEAASASNSWEENEVISVYYDGTYYQASNAMGGGSAMGKKKLTGAVGYLATNEDVIGEYNSNSNYRYIKYPVNPGDVIKISGKGATTPRLWAIADVNESIISRAEAGSDVTGLVLTMPEGAKWIVLNNNISIYPNYEWYYAGKGSIGAHEILTEPYLYDNWRILSIGQTYSIGENVKSNDGQFLKIAKEIGLMNRTDVIAVGDLKCYAQNTYRAQKAIPAYNSATTYTDGDYAIGFPSSYLINIDISEMTVSEDTNITVTIGDATKTITVTSSSSASSIATDIANAFTSIEGWILTNNEDGTLTLKSSTAGANTITISSEVGETGLVITSTLTSGSAGISQYSGDTDSWATVSLADYAANAAEIGEADDTKIWQKVNAAWLGNVGNNVVRQSNIRDYLYNEENVPFSNFIRWAKNCITDGASANWVANASASFYYMRIVPGAKYIVKANNSNPAYYAWLGAQTFDNNNIKSSKVPVYAPGYNTHIKIPVGQRSIIEAPVGSQFLYICQNFATSQSDAAIDNCLPEYIHTYYDVKERIDKLDEQDLKKYERVDLGAFEAKDIWITSGKWSEVATVTDNSIRTKVATLGEGEYILYFKGSIGRYTFLTSATRIIGEPVAYAEGYGGTPDAAKGYKLNFSVPEGSKKYLMLVCNGSTYIKEPELYRYKDNEEILPSINLKNYEVKDITSQVVGWFSNADIVTNLGNGNATIKKISGGRRHCVNLGAVPLGALVRLRFDLDKSSSTGRGGGLVYYSTYTNTSGTNYTFTDINGHYHYITGNTNHYDIVFINKGYPYIGWGANLGASRDIWTISNFKLELLIKESDKVLDQNITGHRALPKSADAQTSPVTLLHFSDLHGHTPAATGIRSFYDKYSKYIDDMLNTGDVAEMDIGSPIDFYKETRINSALFAVGNHDQAANGGNTYTTHTTDKIKFETYYGIDGEYMNNWNVVRPEGAVYECYYYKDYSNSNIRLIVIDTSLSGQDEKDAAQLQWFKDVLADSGTNNKNVVIAAHYPIRYPALQSVERGSFPVIDSRTGTCTTFSTINTTYLDGTPLYQGTDQNYNGSAISEEYPNALDEFIASYPGRFICWLCGHHHDDYFYYPYNHPDILTIAITTTKHYNSDGIYEQNNPFTANVISLYPSRGIIKVTRIGREKDLFFRHTGTLIYSYKQKKVLFND